MARSSTSGQGRPKGALNRSTKSVRELAADFSAKAIEVLVNVMNDSMSPHAARIAAARELLDRAHGRPSATTSVTVNPGATLAEIGNTILRAATGGGLPLDHAGQLMQAVGLQARIVEQSEVIQRLEALESLMDKKHELTPPHDED